jgi:plasmid segregation protein ParM
MYETQQPVIAIDLGHSAVKVAIHWEGRGDRIIFPSVVTAAIQISEEAAQAIADRETVVVGERRYFVGETAALQGISESESGMNEQWISHHHHTALLLGALKKIAELRPAIQLSQSLVVMGLPAAYYYAQKPALLAAVRPHTPGATLVVLPQPMGPYLALQFDEHGREMREHAVASQDWACIDIGHLTSDICLIVRNTWVERARGSCAGAYRVVEALAAKLSQRLGVSVTLLEAQSALVSGSVRVFGRRETVTEEIGAATAAYADEVLEYAALKLDRDARALDGILVAGGGAHLIYDRVRQRWPNAVLAEHGRFDIVEGYLRSGLALARDNQMRKDRLAPAGVAA